MKNYLKLYLIVILFCIIITPGCFEEYNKDHKSDITYEFIIEFSEKTNVTVRIPVPEISNEILDFGFSEQTNFDPKYKSQIVINSTYGTYLELESNNTDRIEFKSIKSIYY